MEDKDKLNWVLKANNTNIIKVVGVGGGGGNAVNHMYKEGIQDVSFVLCNTDRQALMESAVPTRVLLGPTVTSGLGAGNVPEKAREAAEESVEEIRNVLADGTKMVFVTAGMGGGTGTGAAPVIAKIAKELGILTVGIVTIPFLFEKKPKVDQALNGAEAIRENVDALLVINNERLREIYPELTMSNAYKLADETLLIAAKSIAEIITLPGVVNLDFADVSRVLKDGGSAVMSSGFGKGEDRVKCALEDALHSPLLNNKNVFDAQKILFNIYSSKQNELKVEEMNYVDDFMEKFDSNIEVIWGWAIDDKLGEEVKITVLATGFGVKESLDPSDDNERKLQELRDVFYPGSFGSSFSRRNIPKPTLLSEEQMDDDTIISLLENNPAYCRDAKVLQQIKNALLVKEDNQQAPTITGENIINFN